ncbi:hypothetical protein FRC06_008793 [Ceratobasidium sp. 370]|nr:hypothetical protein FRC06_008793 [Ceratobasidium sp. 370]
MLHMRSPDGAITASRDASPESIADLFTHFTIGAPATNGPGEPRQVAKQKSKTAQRLSVATKRRLPASCAATQPGTRGIPPSNANTKATNTAGMLISKAESAACIDNHAKELTHHALPTATAFTFESSKTIDFSHPIPSFPRSKAVDSQFISQPSSFPRAIQSLPPDILVPVIRLTEPGIHLEILKSLSLVNKALHYAIAPILYKNLCLTSLSQVHDFSLGLRHPLCVASLQMFLTPDPKQPEWLPSDPHWIKGLVNSLYSLERLISLGIKRCGNKAVSQAIISQSNNTNFLPSLQCLSFGALHQFAALSLGRPIRSCGFTFQIKEAQDCDKLKSLLTTIVASGELLRELQITINIPAEQDRSKVLKTIGECAPGLRRLSVRFQLKGHLPTINFHSKVIARSMPSLEQLTSLELFDTARFEGDMYSHIAAATALTKPGGPCPNLQLVNFDGTLWKRTPPSLIVTLPAITQDEKVGNSEENKRSTPKLLWTPRPASQRGCNWWGGRAYLLEAKSQQQAVLLLRRWILQYWNLEDMWEVEPKTVSW